MADRRIGNRSRRIAEVAILVVLAALTLGTFLAAWGPVNKYAGWWDGTSPPYDCDGPAVAWLLLAPFAAAVVLTAGLSLAVISCARVALKVPEIVHEQRINRDACR
jgi:hypothetical protein